MLVLNFKNNSDNSSQHCHVFLPESFKKIWPTVRDRAADFLLDAKLFVNSTYYIGDDIVGVTAEYLAHSQTGSFPFKSSFV